MKPEYIIIHHSLTRDGETVSWNAIRRYHMGELGWRDIGYHFGIEMIGTVPEILLGRMMNESGAHCKEERMNQRSLGICFVGNFDEDLVPPLQLHAGIRLVKSLIEIFNIPVENVVGHRDLAGYKSCPGKHFSVDFFRSRLA